MNYLRHLEIIEESSLGRMGYHLAPNDKMKKKNVSEYELLIR
jgi:hypothetical protein